MLECWSNPFADLGLFILANSFLALIFVLAAMTVSLDNHLIWRLVCQNMNAIYIKSLGLRQTINWQFSRPLQKIVVITFSHGVTGKENRDSKLLSWSFGWRKGIECVGKDLQQSVL